MKRYIISPGGHPAVLRFEESPVGTWVEAEEAIADRRERIATAAMAALLTRPEGAEYAAYANQPPRLVAKEAVEFADALIAELDKPTEGGGA